IPDNVTVSVQGLAAGAAVLAKDLVLPEGVKLTVEEDTVVLQVLAAQAEEVSEGEEEAAEA
ncbi:50S ribosomal protein L25, partial [Streptomyces sp. NWU339]